MGSTCQPPSPTLLPSLSLSQVWGWMARSLKGDQSRAPLPRSPTHSVQPRGARGEGEWRWNSAGGHVWRFFPRFFSCFFSVFSFFLFFIFPFFIFFRFFDMCVYIKFLLFSKDNDSFYISHGAPKLLETALSFGMPNVYNM